MNLQRHDISIKTSEEEGFGIYILYYPSVSTRSATHDQPEEWSEVKIEGVYYDENNHKLSAEHMARLPFDKADLLDVKDIDLSEEKPWQTGVGAIANMIGVDMSKPESIRIKEFALKHGYTVVA